MRTAGRLLLLLLLVRPAAADADDRVGPGLDLVVLVDRSDSMTAYAGAELSEALPLTLDAVAWSARASGLRHRIAFVSFGSRARVDVPMTLIGATTESSLQRRVAAADRQRLGNTDFALAFRAAAATFDDLPGEPLRRRAILLITDGAAFVPGESESRSLARLEASLRTIATPQVSIDVVLLAQRAARWRRLTGVRVHQTAVGRGRLLEALHEIVGRATGSRATRTEISGPSQTLILPPYLDLVVFDVVHEVAASDVSIFAPDATHALMPQSDAVEEIRVGKLLSTIIVRRPAAGIWTFRKSKPSTRVTVLSQQFFPRGALLEPQGIAQRDDVTIRYRLNDGKGLPLEQLPRYPLTLDVALATPGGEHTPLPMLQDASAIYHSSQAVRCSTPGQYWTEVHVTTNDDSGQRVVVFDDRWSGFAVVPERPGEGYVAVVTPPETRVIRSDLIGARSPWLIAVVIAAAGGAVLLLQWRR